MSDINNADCFNCGCSCDNVACYTRNDAQLEKMHEEIATLRSLVGQDNLAVLDKLIDAQKEIATLTAKHDRLVKGLESMAIRVSYDEKGRFGEQWDSIKCSEIKQLLAEEGNV